MADPHVHSDQTHSPEAPPHHGVGHVVSPKILIATALGLLVLTALTVTSAKIDFSQLDLNELNITIALAIAVIKASLVCLFFMHLRWDRPFNAFVLVTALSLVGLFIWFAMTDSSEYKPEVVQTESTVIQSVLPPAEPGPTIPAPAASAPAPGSH
jgi:cytochrome c oxidase subunit IV